MVKIRASRFISCVDRAYGFIYLLRNLLNGKGYVGQTRAGRVEQRWAGHAAISASGCTRPLYRSIKRLGFDAFGKTVLWTGPVHLLNEMETYYIKKLHTFIDDPLGGGYNLTMGGDAVEVVSKQTRKRMSVSAKERAADPEYRLELSKRAIDRLSSPEVRLKMSERSVIQWADSILARKTRRNMKRSWKSLDRRVTKSTAVTASWADPVYRAKNLAGRAVNVDKFAEGARKGWAKQSKRQRSERSRAAHAKLTPEQRSARAHRAWETKRRKAARR